MPVSFNSPRFAAEDNSGRPLVGGQLFIFLNKTTLAAITYMDAAGTAPNTNPIILDGRGEAVIFVAQAQVYTFVLKDRFGALIWSQDDISWGGSGGGSGDEPTGVQQQQFLTSGTFTVPDDVHFIILDAAAGGGPGGKGGAKLASDANRGAGGGGGGGAGQTAVRKLLAVIPGATIEITVGTGGIAATSSTDGTPGTETKIGDYVTLAGGLPGANGGDSNSLVIGSGGDGGVGFPNGSSGSDGSIAGNGGPGASTPFGGGGGLGRAGTGGGQDGSSGSGFGSGGGGGGGPYISLTTSTGFGGNGAPGFVSIEWSASPTGGVDMTALAVTVEGSKEYLVGFQSESAQSIVDFENSADAVLHALGYEVPVAFAPGLVFYRPTQTVTYNGQTYAPVATALPFTTTSTFNPAQSRLIQGVTGADIGAPNGAQMVGFIQDDPQAVADTALRKAQEEQTVTDYMTPAERMNCYLGMGTVDVTAACQKALNKFKRVVFPSPGAYKVNALSVGAGTALVLAAGALLIGTNPLNNLLTFGKDCSLVGEGKIVSPAVFNGGNTGLPTNAVVLVTGDGFYAGGVTLENVPKVGFQLKDSTAHRFVGTRIVGNYPYASYDPSTTTGHFGIQYDPPASSTTTKTGLTITGCHFESCIQGVSVANFGAAGIAAGVTISGSRFNLCWDHGVYMQMGEAQSITGCTFLDCRNPIVTDGNAATIVGNTLYSLLGNVFNSQQIISVRAASYSIITDNTLFGRGAAIALENVTGTALNGNLISFNSILSTGIGDAGYAIRLGNANTEVCRNNKVFGNTIGSDYITISGILLSMKTGFKGYMNEVECNNLDIGVLVPAIQAQAQLFHSICRNKVRVSGNSPTAVTLEMIKVALGSMDGTIDNNILVFDTGGTNVTVRGISIESGSDRHRGTGNRFFLTASSLTGKVPIFGNLSTNDFYKNQFDSSAKMSGSFAWSNTTNSVTVSNPNVTTNSRICLTPKDAAAGTVVQSKGIFITTAAGSFTVTTANAAVTGAVSQWDYDVA